MEEGQRLTVYLFSHSADIDGWGANVLLNRFYGEKNVVAVNIDYDQVNQEIKNFIDSYEVPDFNKQSHADELYITDISLNKDTAELLDQFINKINDKGYVLWVHHFDHHESAEWMNKYGWSVVREGPFVSGTSLLYNYLLTMDTERGFNLMKYSDIFVSDVTDYDTWNWTKDHNQRAKDLNDIFHLLGHKWFVDRFTDNISPVFSAEESNILRVEHLRIKRYISGKKHTLIKKTIDGKNVGIVFAEQYLSELGNVIAKDNPDLDYVAMINPSMAVSLRSSDNGADVSKVAEFYQGGGHYHSAGFPLSDSFRNELIHLAFWDVSKISYEGNVN